MTSNQELVLPLYCINKTAKIKSCNEKQLILFVFVLTVVSIFAIFKNLPTHIVDESRVRNVFVPKIPDDELEKIHHKIKHEKHLHPKIPVITEENDKKLTDTNYLRREKVKNMTLLAWTGYKTYAWGSNELKPISKTGHASNIFGGGSMGATIVDALDTLFIMDLKEEYKLGKEWIQNNLNLNLNSEMSAFEVNIRFVGGLLSLHSLTKDQMFLDKAKQIADLLLPIFDTPTGIPFSLINPQTKSTKNYNWAANSCSILAEFGTLSLEFEYLSDNTGNKIYKEKIDKIFAALEKVPKDEGLFYNYMNPINGEWCAKSATFGALSDSFYEYLLKLWLYENKSDKKLLDFYLKTIRAAEQKLIGKSPGGLTFAGEYNHGSMLNQRMGHLACFTGGLFALSSMYIDELDSAEKEKYRRIAEEITNTCHESYIRTPTHLGPESFQFSGVEATALVQNDKYYILRPEVVESYFYLWRMTKDNKYREWAWDVVEALEKYCKTDSGYSGLRDVYSPNPVKDDVQQSFFLAETLKYLYLTFSDDDLIPLDKYVFNTEAHPILIKK